MLLLLTARNRVSELCRLEGWWVSERLSHCRLQLLGQPFSPGPMSQTQPEG